MKIVHEDAVVGCYLAAELLEGRNRHSLNQQERELVRYLEALGLLERSSNAGFVGNKVALTELDTEVQRIISGQTPMPGSGDGVADGTD